MVKRGILHTSPEHPGNKKRHQSLSEIEPKLAMGSTSTLSVDRMQEILLENNKKLVEQLASKADLQDFFKQISALSMRQEELEQKVVYLEEQNKRLENQLDRLIQMSIEANLVVHLPVED